MNNALLQELLGRTHQGARAERELIVTAAGIVDNVQEAARKFSADSRFSDVGRKAKILEHALGDPWSHFVQLRAKAAALHVEIEKNRSQLVPKRLDPGDLVGALQNSEMRAALRAAKPADRLRLAQNDDAFATAALLAHPALSGLSAKPVADGQPSEFEMVRDAYQRRNFSEQIAGIQLREETMIAVDAALRSAADQILSEAGISEAEVDSLRPAA